MANTNNKTVSINVEINAEGQRELNQYKGAFDSLRTSINNLSSPISKLDADISKLSDSIGQMKSENDSVVDSIIKVSDTLSAFKNISDKVGKAIEILKIGVAGFEAELTAGLSLIIAFLPEIIKWVGGLGKGNTTLSALNKTLKDTSIVVGAVNDARLQGTQNAQQELVHLKLLYNAARDQNLSAAERKKILGELQNQYPGYFDKMTLEKIKNGEAAKSYNLLTESILANSRARAAENVMVKNQERSLGNDNNITKLKAQLAEYNKKLAEAKKAEKSVVHGFSGVPGIYYNVDSKTQNLAGQLSDLQSKRDETQRQIDNLYTDSSLLNRQNQALAKTISDNTEKFGAKTLGVSDPVKYQTGTTGHKKTGKAQKTKVERDPFIPIEQVKPDTSAVANTLDQDLQKSLNTKENIILDHTAKTQRAITDIEVKSAKERADAEDQLTRSKIHAGDKFIDAALKNSKKDSAIFKTAFLAKKATAIADTIISTKRAVMDSLKAYSGIPFIGQALGIAQAVFMGAQGAASAAEIAKQKPGFASGGRFVSDGKGALLGGYSRTDNTNAFLRSGEAVVVSEAMRDPWARNLVSAINVAYGGRDFSMANPHRGYAIGGIFTDGGNSNRYYNAPMNDQKDLANTIAYQMVNNFPPVYVDVKDINTQQSILAQTINRVNL